RRPPVPPRLPDVRWKRNPGRVRIRCVDRTVIGAEKRALRPSFPPSACALPGARCRCAVPRVRREGALRARPVEKRGEPERNRCTRGRGASDPEPLPAVVAGPPGPRPSAGRPADGPGAAALSPVPAVLREHGRVPAGGGAHRPGEAARGAGESGPGREGPRPGRRTGDPRAPSTAEGTRRAVRPGYDMS